MAPPARQAPPCLRRSILSAGAHSNLLPGRQRPVFPSIRGHLSFILQVHTSDFSSLATSDLELGNDALTGSTLETPEQEARWHEKQHEVRSF